MKSNNRKFKIIILFYNAKPFVDRSLRSAINQDYDNFEIVMINDCSTDGSKSVIKNLLKEHFDKITYIENKERKGAMHNHQYAIFNHCDEDDVVLHLDGDDWLKNNNVLTYLNDLYNKGDYWMVYGQLESFSAINVIESSPYKTKEEFENKRDLAYRIFHPRTFLAKAFFEIRRQDPELKCFKNPDGTWYESVCDFAMMYPLLEICGYNRVKYNDKILYVYNDINPINDCKVDSPLQIRLIDEITKKQPKFKQFKEE